MPDETAFDDDMLSPPVYPSTETPEDPDDPMAETWHFSHGFPDGKRAVRVWVDDASRHLEKVRISPRWREILGNRSLEEAFSEAFFLANARLEDSGLPQFVPSKPEPRPELSWSSYDEVREQLQRLSERADELDSRPPEDVRWADYVGQKTTATSPDGHVQVTLSIAGLTESVRFTNRSWLAAARSAEISEAVMQAHRAAYRRYTPPQFVPGEHEELAEELAHAQAALMTIVSKGIR